MIEVYLEVAEKRSFACAVEWPGWCRSGRDPEKALEALNSYRDRYLQTLSAAGISIGPAGDLKVIDTLVGDGSTEFGVPGRLPSADLRPFDRRHAKRLVPLWKACWAAFDRVAATAPNELRKGPRGGGRDLAKMVGHVFEAEGSYAFRLGLPAVDKAPTPIDMTQLRLGMVDAVLRAAAGESLQPKGRERKLWPPRYTIRRSAWHALDHAWEIEDRAVFPPPGA